MGLAYLDVDDEITSAAGRIRAATDPEVVLVLPAGSRLGTSRINFRMLAREAAAMGRDLAIVSPEPSTRSLAASAGLPAYATVVDYEAALADGPSTLDSTPGAVGASVASGAGGGSVRSGAGPRGRPATGAATESATELPSEAGAAGISGRSSGVPGRRDGVQVSRPRGRRRGLALGLGALVVLAVLAAGGAYAALTLLPTATIRLVVQPTALAPLSLTVTADPSATAPDVVAGVVPAERRTFPLSASATFQATGKKVTETKATGVVRWQNCDPTRSYAVPAGTIVQTKTRVAFTIDETVFLPVAILAGNPITISCQARDVGVTAANAGTGGNVAAGTITVVPANYNSVVIRVANPADTTGGTHVETPLVAKKDVDAAVKKLNAQLDAALAASLKDSTVVGTTGAIFPETGTRTPAQSDQDTSALVGQQQSSFDLALTSTGSVLAVDTSLVASVADQRLRASVPAGEDLLAGSTHVEVGKGTVAGGKVTFPATATAMVVRRIDPAAVRAAVRGRSLADARAALEAFGDATVVAWPDWVSSIPSDDSRVAIDISYAGGSTEPASGPGASASDGTGPSSPVPGSPSASPGAS